MFIEKLYAGHQLAFEDVTRMVKMFFKIKKVEVESTKIDRFVEYMTNYNRFDGLNMFITIEQMIWMEIMPTIEKEIDFIKFFNKNNQLVKIQYSSEKFNQLA